MADQPRRERRRGSRGTASERTSVPSKVTTEPHPASHLGMETAPISAVTSEMMNEAAHRVADAVAAASVHSEAEANPERPSAPPEGTSGEGADDALVARRGSAEGELPPRVEAAFAGSAEPSVPAADAPLEDRSPAAEAAASDSRPPADMAARVSQDEAAAPADVAAWVSQDEAAASAEPAARTEPPSDMTPPLMARNAPSIDAYNAKLVEFVTANVTATNQFLTALLGATSVNDIVILNADHLRRHIDLVTAQGRELSNLAQKVVLEAVRPFSAAPRGAGRGR